MLITNFAAGELAETLFGRTDMGQYYSGVSHLENFDVIPTGGISRRHGMKRIRRMEGEGRIIPFILNRESSFLLFLTPGKIQILRGGDLIYTVESSGAVPLYQTMAEINEVQYAQNYDKMIMVHENYAPISVSLTDDHLSVTLLYIDSSIPLEGGEDIPNRNDYIEDDPAYKNSNGYVLRSNNNFPRCVTFMNGRLVFAGTKTEPQRIFASSVNKFNKFATYKKYLVENKEYIVIFGTLDEEQKNTIFVDSENAQKLKSDPKSYYVEADYFRPGTKVDVLTDHSIIVSEDAILIPSMTTEEKNEFSTLQERYTFYNNNPSSPIYMGTYEFRNVSSSLKWADLPLHATVYANKISFDFATVLGFHPSGFPKEFTFPSGAAGSSGWESNWLNGIIAEIVAELGGAKRWEPSVNNAQDIIRERVMNTMQFYLRGIWYYDLTPSIVSRVNSVVNSWKNVYIPMFKSTPIEDRYPTADDGFTFEIASDMSDAIKWLAQNKNLLVGTETGEWVIPAGVNATNVQAVLNSRYGSDRIQATTVGDAVCFFQSGKKALVEYYIPRQDTNFRANNMAMLSKNMLHESPAFDFDFVSAPYTKIFVSREDGTIVCLLYERNTGTFAWGRITTRGKIKSVATVPGQSGYDDMFMIVDRNGVFYLESFSDRPRETESGEEAVFLDNYKKCDGVSGSYTGEAVVYDETANKVYPKTQAPITGHKMWIGYPYESRVRSMPVLANDRMKQNNIKNLYIRFNDSFMPKVRSVSMEEGKERMGNTDSIGRPEPYSGVVQIAFPGVWDRDVFFELIHDKPARCRVLAVNAEAN
jgi:hypothetical protein